MFEVHKTAFSEGVIGKFSKRFRDDRLQSVAGVAQLAGTILRRALRGPAAVVARRGAVLGCRDAVPVRLAFDGGGRLNWFTPERSVTSLHLEMIHGRDRVWSSGSNGILRADGVQGLIDLPTDLVAGSYSLRVRSDGRDRKVVSIDPAARSLIRNEARLPSGMLVVVRRDGSGLARLEALAADETKPGLTDISVGLGTVSVALDALAAGDGVGLRARGSRRVVLLRRASSSLEEVQFELRRSELRQMLDTKRGEITVWDLVITRGDRQLRPLWSGSLLSAPRVAHRYPATTALLGDALTATLRPYWTNDQKLAVEFTSSQM